MEPQALKLHKNFDHFKYSLHMNEKSINFGLNILCSLSQVHETIYTLTEYLLHWNDLYQNEFVSKWLVNLGNALLWQLAST